MRKLKYFLLLLLFVSCGSVNDINGPGGVAVRLFSAITSGDSEFVKNNIYISDDIQREVFYSAMDIAVKSEQYKQNTEGFTPSYKVARESIMLSVFQYIQLYNFCLNERSEFHCDHFHYWNYYVFRILPQ